MNNVLIRSARFGKEPVVLNHERLGTTLPAGAVVSIEPTVAVGQRPVVEASRSPEPEKRLEPAPTATLSAAASEEPEHTVSVAEPAPTYDDFRRIFEGELEQLKSAARESGYAEGKEKAEREVQAQYASELESLKSLVRGVRENLDQQFDGVIDTAVEVVFEAVTRIVGESYQDRSGVAAIVREVVRHAKDRSRLVVRVHPGDQAVLQVCADDVARGMSCGPIEVAADDRVAMGGCMLETPAGNLDGRLEIQLQQLRDVLINARTRWNEATP
jgi:flagellar biosynthesis/type III secretory pathway protein FliH